MLITLIGFPSLAQATVILDDTFSNTNNVDLNLTTATVDTATGCVLLPQVNKPSAIAMKEFGYEYAVATKDGVKMFSFDDATGNMVENTALSIPTVTNALGIAVRQDSPNIWTLTENELSLYKFNSGSMSTNPNLIVSGLTGVVSVSSWSNQDKAAVLSRSGSGTGTVKVFNANSGTVQLVSSFDTGKINPTAISVVSGSPDLVVATEDAYYYYAYDDATGNYIEDPRRTVTGLSNIISISSENAGSAVLVQNEAQYYMNNDAGTPEQAIALSKESVSGVAISVNPSNYDYAILSDNGNVQYYTYDDATGSMSRVNSLEVTGLSLTGGYLFPRNYHSKIITTAQDYDEIRLTVDQSLPASTSIDYFVTSDNGTNWVSVIPGDWIPITSGNQFAVKAILNTSDQTITPKIFQVTLEATTLSIKELKVLAIAFNEPSQTLPTSTFPVKVKAGAEIQMEVKTEGFAKNVYADFSIGNTSVFSALSDTSNEINTWRGLFTVPVEALEGATITATLNAQRNTKHKHLTVDPLITVNGKVSSVVDLKITK